MVNVSICICTRKRKEGLRRLLHSINEMLIPPDINVRIIIVENDEENLSENIVKEVSDQSKIMISYFIEPRQGIVFARNRSVKEAGECDFCCFTDDDQIVSSDWLTELMKCQQEFDADGVAGPTKPIFAKEVPVYIQNFHQPNTYSYGTVVDTAFTGCLLLRKKSLDMLDGPFDIMLNFSGGEDTYLTRRISQKGGIIYFNPDAIAYEIIPENRLTAKYIIKRKFRTSNTELLIKSMSNKDFSKFSALPRLIMRFCYGLLIFLPFFILSKSDRLKGLIKMANAVGGFAFIFGKQSEFYK
jgi:succinoglycan biosynthesis protein ExoM